MCVDVCLCVCVSADSSDIVDHKLKLILGLIWTLILHYSISMPVWDDIDSTDAVAATSADPSSGVTPKQRLLAWIQNKITDRAINNFTADWSDGRAIGALVDGVAPGQCHLSINSLHVDLDNKTVILGLRLKSLLTL